MKLVYVVKRFPKVSETFVTNEAREVLRQGDDVTICSLQAPHRGEPRHPGEDELLPRTVRVPEGSARFPMLMGAALRVLVTHPLQAWPALGWSLRWAVRQRRFDHVKRFGEAAFLLPRIPTDVEHIHAHFAHGATTVALLLGRMTGRPFSFTGHAKDIFQLVSPDLLAAKVEEARFAVAVSDYTREHIQRALPLEQRAKVVVVRNGIDREQFVRRASRPNANPDASGFERPDAFASNGAPLILAVSRLVEKKGLDTLVDACGALARRGFGFRCEILGDGPLRARLEARVREAGVGDRVALVGARDQAEVRAAYERAAVFALPCRMTRKGDKDGLPVALVEAMTMGVPVVSTPVSGIREVVREGESGLMVPPDDAGALAQAIERLLTDVNLQARVVAGGYKVAEAFDLRSTVARLRQLFRQGPEAP